MDDHYEDPGLNDLLSERVQQNKEFVEHKTNLISDLYATDLAYEAELRRCFEFKKYVRSCEAAVAVQLQADTPMQLEDHSHDVDEDIARIAEHFSSGPSQFMRRLVGD